MKRHFLLGATVVVFTLMFVATMSFAADTKEILSPATQVKSAVKAELVDINTATKEQLKSIPGIGDAYAKKIIDNRPYVKKDQLVSKKVVPQAVYDKIKDMITAKQLK